MLRSMYLETRYVNAPGPLERKFDPGFIVLRVRGAMVMVVGLGNVRKIINRDQVRKVSNDIQWDDLAPRLTRGARLKLYKVSTATKILFLKKILCLPLKLASRRQI